MIGYEKLLAGKEEGCIDEKAACEYVYQKKKNNLEHVRKLIITTGHIGIFGVLVWCAARQIITVGVFAALITSLGELFAMAEEILSVMAEGVSEELEKIRNYTRSKYRACAGAGCRQAGVCQRPAGTGMHTRN